MFSDLTRERFRRFRLIRRAWWSLWILGVAFGLSLFAGVLANDKPLILRYDGGTYFPIVKFYPASQFGGAYGTEPDYRALRREEAFRAKGGWVLMPPIPHNPYRTYIENAGTPPHAPSAKHWLGTDNSARDVLSRLIYGFRICMSFALLLALLETILGIIIGGVQGYLGGKVDITFQRLIEIWSSLPFLYVVILVGATFGARFTLLLLIMAAFGWVSMSYYVRGEFFKIKGQAYVRSARAAGLGHLRIFFHHILPNSLTPVITILPFSVVGGISALTALDFLDFGLPPPTPSWGEMLSQGLENLQKPWLAISSVTALFTTLLLATFIGEGVREAFDPKSGHRIE